MDERELLLAWRQLFRSQGTTEETLAKAEALLESAAGESPLYHRLAKELEELKKPAKRPGKAKAR